MNQLDELNTKRTTAWEAAKAFLESKRNDTGIVSAEDTATYQKMVDEVDAFTGQIEVLEKQAEREQHMRSSVRSPILGNPTDNQGVGFAGLASVHYHADFWNAMRGRGVSNSLKEGADPQGGYLVPEQFERTLVEALEERFVMRQICSKIPTESNTTIIPTVADTGTAAWTAEEAEILESDDTFGQITLSAYKLTSLVKISNELLKDSVFPLESYIAKEFARRIGAKEEEAFLVGTGTNQPTGILNATGGAQVGVTAVSPTAITFDEIIDLFYSLKAPYRANAVFLASDATLGAIRKLKDSTGNYIWEKSSQAGVPGMLLGKPIYASPFMPTMAAGAKTLLFGDFSYYWIADHAGRTIKRLDQLFAITDQMGYLTTERVDGKLILPEAVKVLQTAGT